MAEQVSAKQLAEYLSVTERRVQQLAKDGILPKSGRGKYFVSDCIQAYIKYMTSGMAEGDTKAIDYHKEKARETKYKADLAEIEVMKKRGQLVESTYVEKVMASTFLQIRTLLRDIPSRSVNTLFALDDKKDFKTKLLAEIDAALVSLPEQIDWSPEDE